MNITHDTDFPEFKPYKVPETIKPQIITTISTTLLRPISYYLTAEHYEKLEDSNAELRLFKKSIWYKIYKFFNK